MGYQVLGEARQLGWDTIRQGPDRANHHFVLIAVCGNESELWHLLCG